MSRTYYEVLDANEQRLPSQKRKWGTPAYGYATQAIAERFCPNGGCVLERHQTNSDDWAGRIVAIRTIEGRLERLS